MPGKPQAIGERTPRMGDQHATTENEASSMNDQPNAEWNVAEWHGKMLVDSDGEKIGKLQDVYVDVETDEPRFATVKEGFIGRHLTFVPLGGITVGPDENCRSRSPRSRSSPRRTLSSMARSSPKPTSRPSTTTSSSTTPRPTPRVDAGSLAVDSSAGSRPRLGFYPAHVN